MLKINRYISVEVEMERWNEIKPLISIIMPLYNAEHFLKETLTSIYNQTFKDYELICINDCSDDDTVNIVCHFQTTDSRISCLENKERMGAALTRNREIKEAKGKYIIFLDDIFDEDMLKDSFIKAEEYMADIVMFEIRHVETDNIYKKQTVIHSTEYIDRFCHRSVSIDDLKVCDFLNWTSAICNKLFRREFIIDNYLEFQNIQSNNDTYFVDMAFFLAKKIIILDSSKVMLYARDHFVPTRISMNRNPMCTYYAMIKVKEELRKRGVLQRTYRIFNYRAFQYMFIGLNYAKSEDVKRDFFVFLEKEGFDNLLGKYGTEFGIDDFLLGKKELFLDWKLKEGWDEIFSLYEIYLEEYFEDISMLFSDGKSRGKKIGVWGAGNNGKIFLKFCNKYKLEIEKVIDID